MPEKIFCGGTVTKRTFNTRARSPPPPERKRGKTPYVASTRGFTSPAPVPGMLPTLHPSNMTIRLCSAILGTVVLVWAFATSEGLTADTDAAKGAAQDKNAGAAAPAVDEKALAELRTKREKGQAKLDVISKPK